MFFLSGSTFSTSRGLFHLKSRNDFFIPGERLEVVSRSSCLFREMARILIFLSIYFLYLKYAFIIFFFVLSYKVCVSLNNSSAKSVVGAKPVLDIFPNLSSSML